MGADWRQQEENEHEQWTKQHEQQFREIFGEENGKQVRRASENRLLGQD